MLSLLRRLEAGRATTATGRYDAREIEVLPAPVRRYFSAVLADGQAIVTAAVIELFRAEARGGMVRKAMVQALWEGCYSNHQVRDGMLIPFAGEVA